MEPWRRAFRTGFAPQASAEVLQQLYDLLAADDGRIIQGSTSSPPPLQAVLDWPCQKVCPLGFLALAGAGGWGVATVGAVDDAFARLVFGADRRLGGAGASRFVLNWIDDTPRAEMFRLLADEIKSELKKMKWAGETALVYGLLRYYHKLVRHLGYEEATSSAGLAFANAVRCYEEHKGYKLSASLNVALRRQLKNDLDKEKRFTRTKAAARREPPRVYHDEDPARAEEAARVRSLVERLDGIERIIIEERYFGTECPTFKEIGSRLGLSKSRIEQLHQQALRRLQCLI